MTRYRLSQTGRAEGYIATLEPSPDGAWVRFEDVPQTGTCATCQHCHPYPANAMYLACFAPAPVQIFTPKKAAEWGCTMHEPLPPAPTPPRGETP